jgi:hypothetical protein
MKQITKKKWLNALRREYSTHAFNHYFPNPLDPIRIYLQVVGKKPTMQPRKITHSIWTNVMNYYAMKNVFEIPGYISRNLKAQL